MADTENGCGTESGRGTSERVDDYKEVEEYIKKAQKEILLVISKLTSDFQGQDATSALHCHPVTSADSTSDTTDSDSSENISYSEHESLTWTTRTVRSGISLVNSSQSGNNVRSNRFLMETIPYGCQMPVTKLAGIDERCLDENENRMNVVSGMSRCQNGNNVKTNSVSHQTECQKQLLAETKDVSLKKMKIKSEVDEIDTSLRQTSIDNDDVMMIERDVCLEHTSYVSEDSTKITIDDVTSETKTEITVDVNYSASSAQSIVCNSKSEQDESRILELVQVERGGEKDKGDNNVIVEAPIIPVNRPSQNPTFCLTFRGATPPHTPSIDRTETLICKTLAAHKYHVKDKEQIESPLVIAGNDRNINDMIELNYRSHQEIMTSSHDIITSSSSENTMDISPNIILYHDEWCSHNHSVLPVPELEKRLSIESLKTVNNHHCVNGGVDNKDVHKGEEVSGKSTLDSHLVKDVLTVDNCSTKSTQDSLYDRSVLKNNQMRTKTKYKSKQLTNTHRADNTGVENTGGVFELGSDEEIKMLVSTSTPVLARRRPMKRMFVKKSGYKHIPNKYNTIHGPSPFKYKKESLFIDPLFAHTWHGNDSPCSQVKQSLSNYLITGAKMNNSENYLTPHLSSHRGVPSVESFDSFEAFRSRFPHFSPTLLDAMHKKYCAYQYVKKNHARSSETISKVHLQKTGSLVHSHSDNYMTTSHIYDEPCLLIGSHSGETTLGESSEECRSGETTPNILSLRPTGGVSAHPRRSPDMGVSHRRRRRDLAEIEAVEACKWLRAAGFPQYSQLYEDGEFPVDLSTAEKDHEFLEADALQSLYRRLSTLNKCAGMKLDRASMRKAADDSDDEEQCALSDKWKYVRTSQQWSRVDENTVGSPDSEIHPMLKSWSSHDSLLADQESASQSGDSPVLDKRLNRSKSSDDSQNFKRRNTHHGSKSVSNNHTESSSIFTSPRLKRAASERLRSAKNFLRKVEVIKTRKPRREVKDVTEIGDPVVVDSQNMKAKIQHMNCVKITNGDRSTITTNPVIGNGMLHNTLTVDTSANVVEPWLESDISPMSDDHSPNVFNSSAGSGGSAATGSSRSSGPNTSSRTCSYVNGQFSCDRTMSGLPHYCDNNNSVYYPVKDTNNIMSSSAYSTLPRSNCTNMLDHGAMLRRNHSETDLVEMYLLPTDYVPGSFPKVLSNGYIEIAKDGSHVDRTLDMESPPFNVLPPPHDGSPSIHSTTVPNRRQRSAGRQASRENRMSVYDNVLPEEDEEDDQDPEAEVSTVQQELDLVLQELFQNINSLSEALKDTDFEQQGDVSFDSSILTSKTDNDDSVFVKNFSSSSPISNSHVINESSQSASLNVEEGEVSGAGSRTSFHDVTDPDVKDDVEIDTSVHLRSMTQDEESVEKMEFRERRDSGVGSSLTRAPSDRKRTRVRWHSFQKSHRPSWTTRALQINALSAGQIVVLRKLALLRLTTMMEKYSPTNRSGWNWAVPRFMKRSKTPDYREKNVFGVPLHVTLQRSGQPLPQCILYAMRYLRRTAKDAIGIFRKSGVRSRIQKLRNELEEKPDKIEFGEDVQAYDVADLLKQYFRELPDCLLTNKLSETFISIFTHLPCELHLDAVQSAIILMPDENREVLHALLLFLGDIASDSAEHQMNASNLSVCFAPSLFHHMTSSSTPTSSPMLGTPSNSPKRPHHHLTNNHKGGGGMGLGVPDARELLEQRAAHECLMMMIQQSKKLFTISEETMTRCRFSYIEQGDPVSLEELSKRGRGGRGDRPDYSAYIESCIQGLIKESREKFKGWISLTDVHGIELAYKKLGDGHPLRLWKCACEVEAPPVEVLTRVLLERDQWDEDMMKWRVVQRLDQQTEVFQYVINSMAPHPRRDYCVLRSWRTDLPKGACVLVAASIEHKDAPLIGGIRGVVLASRYLIEPCGAGKSRLTHISRIDMRGRSQEWYTKVYGHVWCNFMQRIRDSFRNGPHSSVTHETKV